MNLDYELENIINSVVERRLDYERALDDITDYFKYKEKSKATLFGELLADMNEFADKNKSEEMSFFMGTLLEKIENRLKNEESEESLD